MNRFFTLLLASSCLTAFGQVTYPYNPDGNADAFIGVTDLQDILSTYGGAFVPSEILVGDSTLSSWVDQLSATVLTQQATIDSLVELQPKEYIFTVADGLDGDWVTIASVGDDSTNPFKLRADADFEFTHNMSSSHQKIKVRASHLFGNGHTLDLHRISYSDSHAMIVAFRIAHGDTYDGAVLQMKVRQNIWLYNEIKLRVTNNNNDSGWHIHPDILQGQSLSADNSPIGYLYDSFASDAPYVEFYPSIDGEDCLGYDTTEGDVILNSNLVVNGMNITEIISSLQNNLNLSVYEATFELDMWGNPLPSYVSGSPEYVLYHYPENGLGELPIFAPDPSGYDPFDKVTFMLGTAPYGLSSGVYARVYFTRMDGVQENFEIQADQFAELILGLDGFWRYHP